MVEVLEEDALDAGGAERLEALGDLLDRADEPGVVRPSASTSSSVATVTPEAPATCQDPVAYLGPVLADDARASSATAAATPGHDPHPRTPRPARLSPLGALLRGGAGTVLYLGRPARREARRARVSRPTEHERRMRALHRPRQRRLRLEA